MLKVKQSHAIIEGSRLANGMYAASTSSDYDFTWFRDTFYIALPYLHTNCSRYEETYHGILDIFRKYEWKLDVHNTQKPREQWEYFHIRFDAVNFEEIDTPWAHVQYDAIGAILYGIGAGIKAGKRILRDAKDREIVQKIVGYLECCAYWSDPDSGMWEEWREIRASSIGAVIAGLQSVSDIVYVPSKLIANGYRALYKLFPCETETRNVDLAQLSLIYPYQLLDKPLAQEIIHNVENELLRERGVLRYRGDSYYSTLETEHGRGNPLEFYYGTEAEWTFGFTFLALAHMEVGNYDTAADYIERAEGVMLDDGSLPELYFAGTNEYNGNTPLIWSQAMYVLAKERYMSHNVERYVG